MKRIMTITVLATILILGGAVLLILGTTPVKNDFDGKTLTIHYIIGKDTIDMTDAHFMPIPDEVNHNIIRIGGTSIGKIHSGNFMNTKTKTKFKFYLTGKGERHYFEIGDKKYLVDDITVPSDGRN